MTFGGCAKKPTWRGGRTQAARICVSEMRLGGSFLWSLCLGLQGWHKGAGPRCAGQVWWLLWGKEEKNHWEQNRGEERGGEERSYFVSALLLKILAGLGKSHLQCVLLS